MDQTQMQQQFETLRNDVNQIKKESARKNAIEKHVHQHYKDFPPGLYAMKLIEALQDRYTSNAAVWKRVIRNLGSAYELALTNFNQIKSTRNMEAQAKEQMVYNILSVFAGAGLCWIGPAVRTSIIFNKTISSEGAKTFFSNGFQEVIKQSGIHFTKSFPEITYKVNLTEKDHHEALVQPLAFQNKLLNEFEYCEEKIQRQLADIKDDFRYGDKSQGPIADILSRYTNDINDYSLSDRQVIEKIDGPYRAINKLVKDLNRHCIETSFYFREKPAFDTESDSAFKNAMAFRFERAMWAAWISKNLKRKDRAQVPTPRTFAASKPWTMDNYSAQDLQHLQTGYYYIPGNPDYVMRVFDKYEKPGRTLEDRLEYLQVIKSRDFRPVPFPDNLRQLEPFGWVTTESDIKRLIAWSRTELDHPYRKKEFQIKTRAPDELYIRPFA